MPNWIRFHQISPSCQAEKFCEHRHQHFWRIWIFGKSPGATSLFNEVLQIDDFFAYIFRNPNALHFSMTNLANFSARKKLALRSDDSCWRISYVPKLAASQPEARLYVSFFSFKVTGISMFRMINEQQWVMSSACCIYFQLEWRPREWLRTRWIESEWCLSEIIQYMLVRFYVAGVETGIQCHLLSSEEKLTLAMKFIFLLHSLILVTWALLVAYLKFKCRPQQKVRFLLFIGSGCWHEIKT